MLLPIFVVSLTLSNVIWQLVTNKDFGKAWERSFFQSVALCLYFAVNLAVEGKLDFYDHNRPIAYSKVVVTGEQASLVKDLVENRLREEGVRLGVAGQPELEISSHINYRANGLTSKAVLVATSPKSPTAIGYGHYDQGLDNSPIRLVSEATRGLVTELKQKMSKVEAARLKYEKAQREFQQADPSLEKDIGKAIVQSSSGANSPNISGVAGDIVVKDSAVVEPKKK